MAAKKKLKMLTLDQMKDEHFGKIGTPKRDQFEFELRLDLIGDMIKKARKERDLTQEELGKLVGVQKAQISKLENTEILNSRTSTVSNMQHSQNHDNQQQ